jgi:hypothetical protein
MQFSLASLPAGAAVQQATLIYTSPNAPAPADRFIIVPIHPPQPVWPVSSWAAM